MNILSWIYAARPKTLVASIVPVISGTLIIPNSNMFKLDIFLFTIIAAIIIQIVTNYINDLHDLSKLLDISDQDLTKSILNKDTSIKLPNNNVVNLLKDFKID